MLNFNDPEENQRYFERLILSDFFYNDTYFYLTDYESEFNDLIFFILNLERSNNLIEHLLFSDWSEASTIKYIIDDDIYYNVDKRLNEFELKLTKYCVAVYISNLSHITLEDSNRNDNFSRLLISKLKASCKDFKYSFISNHISYSSRTNRIKLGLNNSMEEKDTFNNDEFKQSAISWKIDTRILAYTFWKLEQEKIIEVENIGSLLSKIFVDSKKNKIKNTHFNAEFSKYRNGNSFPKKASDIDVFIEAIKAIKA
jgi:hypothetical protein